jgi:UDP-GlcNAc:undecaprenyl-phosphate GlcNAc-1-phosphate transferase
MAANWTPGLISFFCVLICVPIVHALCNRWKLHDVPGPLKIHAKPIARLGGIAIGLGLLVGAEFKMGHSMQILGSWLAAFSVIWLAGLVDDLGGLPPFVRLVAQVVSGILLWFGGWRLPLDLPAFLNCILICAIVILFVNGFNFLDGADGLAAGVTAIVAAGYIFADGTTGDALGITVAWAALGACVGFLLFNFPPAKIFMGDSGSTLLGFCVAYLSINFVSHIPARSSLTQWLFPVLTAALPLVDGMVVVLQRIKHGQSAFKGDRSHYYDFWLARGWSARSVAVGSYVLTGLLCAMGLWILRIGAKPVVILLVATATGIGIVSFSRLPSRGRGAEASVNH